MPDVSKPPISVETSQSHTGTPLSEHQTCVFCEVRCPLVQFTDRNTAYDGFTHAGAERCADPHFLPGLYMVDVSRWWIPPRSPHSDFIQVWTSDRAPTARELQPSAVPACYYRPVRQAPSSLFLQYWSSWLFSAPPTVPKRGHRGPPFDTAQPGLFSGFAKGFQVPRLSHRDESVPM